LRSPIDRRVRLSGLRSSGVIVHWIEADAAGDSFVVGILDCLLQMCLCQPVESVIAAVDSALRKGLLSHFDWLFAIRHFPRRLRRLLEAVDGRSESITESLARVRLLGLGLTPRLQVKIPGVGFVDLLIGIRLVLEIDGFAYHSDKADFENDRRRDARLSARGYRVLRFSYEQVMHHWSEVKAAVLGAVARGDHL
jgi:very-short-patch-repair endonuclease